jgi:hypothetical protein
MNYYLISYQDSEGCTGTTMAQSPMTVTEDEMRETLNEQLAANNIDARVVQIKLKKVSKLQGAIGHWLHNNRVLCMQASF